MSGTFITNQEKLLSKIINNILPFSKELSFLVGYFYFSGFEQIYKNLSDKNIRILVGMEIDRDVSQGIKEYSLSRDTALLRSNQSS